MRRIGDAEWRWFGSRADAAKAFRFSPQDISDLVNNLPKARLRETFEARPACAPPPPRAKKRPRAVAVAQTAPVESHEPPARAADAALAALTVTELRRVMAARGVGPLFLLPVTVLMP